jgi:hypothetical protein
MVAEKVMGALWWRSSATGRRALFLEMPPEWFKERADGTEPLVGDFATYGGFPNYSTDIASAWHVVEWVPGRSEYFELTRAFGLDGLGNWKWQARFNVADERGHVYALADTAPHAICLAALAIYEVSNPFAPTSDDQ